jgi:hypothetical protein
MSSSREEAWIVLGIAVIGGAILQVVAKRQAAVLGLSVLELALLGAGASALITRRLA